MPDTPPKTWVVYSCDEPYVESTCDGCDQVKMVHVFHFASDSRMDLELCWDCFRRSMGFVVLAPRLTNHIRQHFRELDADETQKHREGTLVSPGLREKIREWTGPAPVMKPQPYVAPSEPGIPGAAAPDDDKLLRWISESAAEKLRRWGNGD